MRADPNKGAKALQTEIRESFGLKVPYKMVWYGKELAMNSLHGNEAESYTNLVWFRDEFMKTNPGSRVVVDIDPETQRFQRLFVSFGACMQGFQHCRPMIFVDASFLKNKYKGQIMAASAKDADQGLYPIAFAIVDAENDNNWRWFLMHLRDEIDRHSMNRETNNRRKITFLSDRHNGIMSSLPEVFPDDEHGYYFRHLVANLKDNYRGQAKDRVSDLFMQCAYARSERQYEFLFNQLKIEGGYTEITNFFKDLPKEKWCAAFFGRDRYGEMTNNISECFNSWIVHLRALPVFYLADEIRRKVMERMASKREESEQWYTVLGPRMEGKLIETLKIGRHWRVMHSSGLVYEVQADKYSSKVNMEMWTCSCGQWQLLRFPCAHALVVIQEKGHNMYDYVDSLYKVQYYRQAYSYTLNPVPNIEKSLQDMSQNAPEVRPPLTKKQPGRPKKKRMKKKGEKETMLTECSRCHHTGHNRRTCNNPID